VVAYDAADPWLAGQARFAADRLLVELEGKPSQLTKVLYLHTGLNGFTRELLEPNRVWKMKLSRDPGCDQSLRDFLASAPDLEQAPAMTNASDGFTFEDDFRSAVRGLPDDTWLACYDLREEDLVESARPFDGHRVADLPQSHRRWGKPKLGGRMSGSRAPAGVHLDP
jgi:hypothetical protein